MKKCLLGCGQVVHDVDEHVAFSHPEYVGDEYPAQPPFELHDTNYFAYVTALETRTSFVEDHFVGITL